MANETVLINRRRRFLGLLACGSAAPFLRAFAADDGMGDMHGHDHQHMHMHGAAPEGIKRSEADYAVPALRLVRQDGSPAEFPKEIDDGRPVLLNFIYTSCTAICPLTSQVFSRVQDTLTAEGAPFDMVSISIDPEYDTPARLADYARKFHAGDRWHFYTGSQSASIALQKAFAVWRGDKMNHVPVTFLRAAPGRDWVRLDGLASPDDVIREYQTLAHG